MLVYAGVARDDEWGHGAGTDRTKGGLTLTPDGLAAFTGRQRSEAHIWKEPSVTTHGGKDVQAVKDQGSILHQFTTQISTSDPQSVRHTVFGPPENLDSDETVPVRDLFVDKAFSSHVERLCDALKLHWDVQVHWQPTGTSATMTLLPKTTPGSLNIYSTSKKRLRFCRLMEPPVDPFPKDLDSSVDWYITAVEGADGEYAQYFGSDMPQSSGGRKRRVNIRIGGEYDARISLLSAWKKAAPDIYSSLPAGCEFALFDRYRPVFEGGKFVPEGKDKDRSYASRLWDLVASQTSW